MKKSRVLALFLIFAFIFNMISFRGTNYFDLYSRNKDLRMSVQDITIISPENITYTNPMSGYYPATLGFENIEDGAAPEVFEDISISGSCSVSIYDQIANHQKIARIYDADTGSGIGSDAIAEYNFNKNQSAGIFECWVYKESGDSPIYIVGLQETSYAFAIRIDVDNNGKFEYSNAPSTWVEFGNNKYSDQTWFHLRIDFDCGTDTTDIYLDGVKEVNTGVFGQTADNITTIQIKSAYSGHSGISYFDAVGYSWDPNYNIGDNLDEGLLLSYDNSTNLDWMGYSLDGQTNRTIIGNTTFPFPSHGVHTIQVFGNDSIGTIYSSSMRYFEVDLNSPIISINSPTSDQYFGCIAPNFDLSITETNLNCTWYTLDNGLTNITFTGLAGTISQVEWDKYSDGALTILFYANDSFGRENFTEITINKDATDPLLTINEPVSGDIFTELPPEYNISVTENNLDLMWYTIDGGITNIPFTSLTGFIDSTAWNNAPSGAITIRFYVRDLAGNEVYQEVAVVKRSPSTPPGIPGYDLLILIGVISLVSVLIIRKRHCK